MEKLNNFDCWFIENCQKYSCTDCTKYIQLKWQFDNSGIPKAKYKPIKLVPQDCDYMRFKRLAEIKSDVGEFVCNGNNLYICSEYTGNGKTSWAIKILQSYLNLMADGNYENLQGMYVSTSNLLLHLKDFNNPVSKQFKDNLENVDLVIWDDIAISGLSNYDYTQLYSIIDSRILSEKSNIFTSNQTTIEDLSKKIGSRLASRIFNTSEIIELNGVDRRNGNTTGAK